MAMLGHLLYRRGAVSQVQLDKALKVHARTGSRLGETLVGMGLIGYRALYEAIAEKHGLPFVNLLSTPSEHLLLEAKDAETYLSLRLIPWRRDGESIIFAVCEVSDAVLNWIRSRYGNRARLAITSPYDIRRAVERHFGHMLEQESSLALWRAQPHASARTTLPPHQKKIAIAIAAACVALAFFWPLYAALAFIVLCHVTYGITMVFKYMIFASGTAPLSTRRQKAAEIDEQSLPVYTVLIPMYRETESLPGMLEALGRLDYPASKLDIKLVLESDDQDTLAAAQALKPSYHFDIIRVPPGKPRTKPKACNYALKFAYGEYVTIFDADDRPEPSQLKKAVAAFRSLPADVVCLQARLNYYNAGDNLLTRFFSLEYSILFHFMLHGLERFGIPIPLGGTSNHIALARLKEIGEWDPYNVTEDADLGVRLAARGFKTRMLDSYTMEEAPNRIPFWIGQRSRWIKGYMQTWLVHMRHPKTLLKNIGIKGFIGFQLFVGLSCFTFLTAPVVWAVTLLWLFGLASIQEAVFPQWLVVLTVCNLLLNLVTHWYTSLYCAVRYRRYRFSMIIASVLYPLYMILHSLASYKALWQLIFNPHFWEKTRHGLARRMEWPISAINHVDRPAPRG